MQHLSTRPYLPLDYRRSRPQRNPKFCFDFTGVIKKFCIHRWLKIFDCDPWGLLRFGVEGDEAFVDEVEAFGAHPLLFLVRGP